MSGTEEVPNTRPTEPPINWKEYTWLDKMIHWTLIFLPYVGWVSFGFFCFWLGGKDG